MEKQHKLLEACIAEFFGTGLFVFLGIGGVATLILTNADFGPVGISAVFGFALAMAIYFTSSVSGGHVNPAVTIAMAFFRGFEKHKVIPYIVAQVLGAFCGAALVYLLFHTLIGEFEMANGIVRSSEGGLITAAIFATYPLGDVSTLDAFSVEFVLTAIFMFGILAATDSNSGIARGPVAPIMIGLLLAVIGSSMGTLTGGALNPARDFGPRIFSFFAGWDYAMSDARNIPYFIVPITAPFLGACLGAWLYPRIVGAPLARNVAEAAAATKEVAQSVINKKNQQN